MKTSRGEGSRRFQDVIESGFNLSGSRFVCAVFSWERLGLFVGENPTLQVIGCFKRLLSYIPLIITINVLLAISGPTQAGGFKCPGSKIKSSLTCLIQNKGEINRQNWHYKFESKFTFLN